MLHDSLNAFARITLEDVSAIFQQIHAVNHEYDNIFRQLITRMMENPQNISWTLDVVWAIRGLERIGDHSCYMCKHLIFMIKGENALVAVLQKAENKPFEGDIGISRPICR